MSEQASAAAEELEMLAASLDAFCVRRGGLARGRRLRGKETRLDLDAWAEMGAQGWLGVLIPERFGGLGLGLREAATVMERLSAWLAPEPVAAVSVLTASTILLADNEVLKNALLPGIASGDQRVQLAWRETGRHGGYFVSTAAETPATVCEGGQLLGTKVLVPHAADASFFLVPARSSAGLEIHCVSANACGLELTPHELADGRPAADLSLHGVSVSADTLLASPSIAAHALSQAFERAVVMASAELLGCMSACFRMTLEYLRIRRQFDRPIGAFQALQHRAVDLAIQIALSRAAVEDAIGSENGDLAAAASRAKARASDAAMLVTRTAIQLHGALGFADECDAGLFLKRALATAIDFGGSVAHRRRFATLRPYESAEANRS